MAGKVIIGKNCLVKIVYGDTPYSFRVTKFDESDDAELRKRQFLGRTTPETDRIEDGWSGSVTIADDGPALDLIVADIQARDAANLPARSVSMTLTKVYRDGTTLPLAATYTGVAFTLGTGFGGRKEDVERSMKWNAERRTLA